MKFSDLNENDLKVIKGIHNVVAERGADWRYPTGKVDGTRPTGATFDPKYTDALFGGCYNLILGDDTKGACIIGALAVDQGLPTVRSSSAGADASRWSVSKPVHLAMRSAQIAQDKGFVWGEALKAFNDDLRDRIEDYDAALLDFLAN